MLYADWLRPRLIRGQRPHRQGMNPILQFVGEDRVDQSLPLESGLSGKDIRDDLEPEMRLSQRTRPGMAGVAVGFVEDDKPGRPQRGLQLLANSVGDFGHFIEP